MLDILRQHQAEMERRFDVRPTALFGSVARDEARVDSDVDVLVEYVGTVGWTKLLGAVDYLEAIFRTRVDMMSWSELKSRTRPYVEADLIRVA